MDILKVIERDKDLKKGVDKFINGWFVYNNQYPENKYLILSKTYRIACESAKIQGVDRKNFKWVKDIKDFRGVYGNINYVILYDFDYPDWYDEFVYWANKQGWCQYNW